MQRAFGSRSCVVLACAAVLTTCVSTAWGYLRCHGILTVGAPAATINDSPTKKTCGPFELGFDYGGFKAGASATWECQLGTTTVRINDLMQCGSQTDLNRYSCDPQGDTNTIRTYTHNGCNAVTAITDNACKPDTTTDAYTKMASLGPCDP